MIRGWQTMDREEAVRMTAEAMQIPEVYARQMLAIAASEYDGDVVRVTTPPDPRARPPAAQG